ncbi:MAG TPA: hypothetical protein VNB94_12605 [Mycobacteriales bacterium]|nr:hypothetical protein [Mycobacteriales bacterium]
MAGTQAGRWLRRARIALLALLVAGVAVPVAARAVTIACPSASKVGSSKAPWESMRIPKFGDVGPQVIVDFAVDELFASRVFITNGSMVFRSDDGGCAWQGPVFQVPASPASGLGQPASEQHITDITLGDPGGEVFLTVVEGDPTAPTARPHVYRSRTGASGTYTPGDAGLPPLGKPLELAVGSGPSAPLYLSVQPVSLGIKELAGLTPADSGVLYRSEDRGATWTQQSTVQDLPAAITDIYVERKAPNTLWVISGGKLRVSTDAGATFTYPNGMPAERQASQNFTALDVGPFGDGSDGIFGSSELVIAYSSTGTPALGSYDRGASFFPVPAPAGADSAGHGAARTDLIVSTTGATSHIYLLDLAAGGKLSDITPVDYDGKFAATATRGTDRVYFAKTNDRLLRFVPRVTRQPVVRPPDIPDFETPGVPPPPKAAITPPTRAISIPYNQRVTLNSIVNLPPRPTPVDVMFLVDTSGSMQGTIDALKDGLRNIAEGLADLRIDAQAGIAQYNVVQEPQNTNFRPSECSNQLPMYSRLRDIGPIDDELLEEIAALRACGSGPEPVLLALEQLATGSGRDSVRLAGSTATQCGLVAASPSCSVKPDQQATWRPGTVRIVVDATDEQFLNGPESRDHIPDQPTLDEVARLYKEQGNVQHIGISAGAESLGNLRTVSTRIGSIAPAEGVDCDGDGGTDSPVDLQPGDALVCPLNYDDPSNGSSFANIIVNLVKAVKDIRRLDVAAPSLSPVLESVKVSQPEVNVKQTNRVRFDVTYSCVGLAAGRYTSLLDAYVAGKVVASQRTEVTCQPARRRPPVLAVPPLPLPPLVTLPGPPGQPNVPVQSNPNPNPQPNANLQAAAAEQEQQQAQVATVEQEKDEEEEEYAMSALSRESDEGAGAGAAVMLGLAGIMSAGCAGIGLSRLRTRTAPVVVRAR